MLSSIIAPCGLFAQPDEGVMVCGTSGGTGPEDPQTAGLNNSCHKYVRIAFHYILSEQLITRTLANGCGGTGTLNYFGQGNFTEYSDGNGNASYNGFQRTERVIGNANDKMQNNWDHWRKEPGQTYPVPPPTVPIRYLLVGTYFHRDNDAFNATKSAATIHTEYGVGGNEVLDIYCVWWPNADWTGNAFAFGAVNKYSFLNDYTIYLQPNCRTWSDLEQATNLIHEVGHNFNLYHTWNEPDGCADTPEGFVYDKVEDNGSCTPNQKAVCWSYNPGIPGCPRKPCDEWPKISNNFMDYSEGPHAFTLCQNTRLNAHTLGNGLPYVAGCLSCAPPRAFFFIPDEVSSCPPGSSVTLNGQASVNENNYRIEICEVSDNNPTVCIGNYYDSGLQSGQVGKVNLTAVYSFQPLKAYRIKLTVSNSACTDAGDHTWEKVVHTRSCTPPDVPTCCFDVFGTSPFGDNLSVYYHTPIAGILGFTLVNLNTSQVYPLLSATDEDGGDHQRNFNTGNVPSGTYALHATFQGHPYSKTLVKL